MVLSVVTSQFLFPFSKMALKIKRCFHHSSDSVLSNLCFTLSEGPRLLHSRKWRPCCKDLLQFSLTLMLICIWARPWIFRNMWIPKRCSLFQEGYLLILSTSKPCQNLAPSFIFSLRALFSPLPLTFSFQPTNMLKFTSM